MADERVIGVFDSGVGGISVLRRLVAELPFERFSFFGDSAHAPYGDKSIEEIMALSEAIVARFVDEQAKAVVIACNTATSAAAAGLRERYPQLPIVGVEPALKPAVRATPHGRILVMATPVTLALEKYQKLVRSVGHSADIIPLACDGLAARIERGDLDAPDLRELVDMLIGPYRGTVDGIVLGCTHYTSAASVIRDVMGSVPLYDSRAGTARQLRRRLGETGLLAPEGGKTGVVSFASSKDTTDEIELYRWFYRLPPDETIRG